MRIDYPKYTEEGELWNLWQLAFGDSEEFTDLFFDRGYDPRCCRCLTLEGRVAAALYWFDVEYDGEFYAYLYGVATHPDFRGRGLCRKLMEDTHACLTARGYAGGLLTPAEENLRKMYAGMGYEDCCTVSEIRREAGKACEVRLIGRDEYALLRRQYLPKGGVIQEGRNLFFLEGFAQLYRGKDFLLAAVPEGERLRGLELLGNAQAAPGILGALGYEEGIFRMPGDDLPFTMFHPLKAGGMKPEYFGLAFD